MANSYKAFCRVVAFFAVCIITIITLFVTGVLGDQGSEDGNPYGGNKNYSGSANNVPSALTITLSGDYLGAFDKASKTISESDTKSLILIKVGLQILQSQTIEYENALHFYSLEYTNSGGTAGAKSYSLENCINRINAGNSVYTDCFGFVRLVYSIACYTINSSSPESVLGISGLYGWKGAYSEGADITLMSNLKSGAVIYDTKTGLDAGYSTSNRHVSMYLYTYNDEIIYMDQGGIKTGEFVSGNYIYSSVKTIPYKFDKFKNYN